MANERVYIEKRLAEYLSQRLAEKQIPKAAFADDLGLAPAVLSRILGASAGLDADSKVFQRIAEKLGYGDVQLFVEVLLKGNDTFSPDYLTLTLPHCLEVAPLFTLQKQDLLPEHTKIQELRAYDFGTPPEADVYVWPRKSYLDTWQWVEVSQISEAHNVVMYVFGENAENLPQHTTDFWHWLVQNPDTHCTRWPNDWVKEQVEVFLSVQMQSIDYQNVAARLATKMSVFDEAAPLSSLPQIWVGFDTQLSAYRQAVLPERPYTRINLSKSMGMAGQWACSLWASPKVLDNPQKMSKLIELTEKIHGIHYETQRLFQAEKAHLAEVFFPENPQALTLLDTALQDIRFDFVNQFTQGFVKQLS